MRTVFVVQARTLVETNWTACSVCFHQICGVKKNYPVIEDIILSITWLLPLSKFAISSSISLKKNRSRLKEEQRGKDLPHLSWWAEVEETCIGGNEWRNGTFYNISKSIIQGLTEDEIRAEPCWSIGPDNVVIKCNWLLIGHNALHLHSFNYVWLSCPSIDGSSHCELSSSMQLSVALMIFDCGGNEWLRSLNGFHHLSLCLPWRIGVLLNSKGSRGSGGQQISDLITLECPYSSRLVWEMVGSARSCVSVYWFALLCVCVSFYAHSTSSYKPFNPLDHI